jgi:hypothetical protein
MEGLMAHLALCPNCGTRQWWHKFEGWMDGTHSAYDGTSKIELIDGYRVRMFRKSYCDTRRWGAVAGWVRGDIVPQDDLIEENDALITENERLRSMVMAAAT